MQKKSKVAVRIETNKAGELLIKRIIYKRFSFHGFGSFIWKLKPEEISISPQAFKLLASRVGYKYSSMGDLAGLEFSFSDTQYDPKYNGFTMSYGFLGCELNVPVEDVLIDHDSFENLKQAIISEDTLAFDSEDFARWENIDKMSDEESQAMVKKFYERKHIPKE